MRAERLAVAPSAEGTYRANACCSLALQQQGALLGAPPSARSRMPGFAQRRALAEALHRRIQVQQGMPLRRCPAERVQQEGAPFPEPWRPLGEKEPVVRLRARAALPGGAPQGEPRLRPGEHGVNARGQARGAFALRIHDRDDQPLGFTPCPCIALASFVGLRASFGLPQPEASAIAAEHDTPPRPGGLTPCRVELLGEPRPGRLAVGDQPDRCRLQRHPPIGQHVVRLV